MTLFAIHWNCAVILFSACRAWLKLRVPVTYRSPTPWARGSSKVRHFSPFLPGLCRHILGEELKLPSVATWWCGQAKSSNYVLEHLDDIVVKAGIATQARKPSFGGRLSMAEREELVGAIRARPFEFVGQEQVALSTVPMWLNDKLEARRVSVRAYVANQWRFLYGHARRFDACITSGW